jgi:hypothetical protein
MKKKSRCLANRNCQAEIQIGKFMRALSISFLAAIVVLGTSGCHSHGPTAAQIIEKLQTKVLAQEIEINKWQTSRELGTSILRDIAAAAIDLVTSKPKNQRLLRLIVSGGITIRLNNGTPEKPLTVNHIVISVVTPTPEESLNFAIPADAIPEDISRIKAMEGIYQANKIRLEQTRSWLVMFDRLCRDLLELAKTDPDAKRLVLKYNIAFRI